MGIDISAWRCRIGCFSQPLKTKCRLKTIKIQNISIFIRVCLFLLLVVQGIEWNPGPGTGSGPGGSSNTRSGSRGGATSGNSGNTRMSSGAGRGRGASESGRGGKRDSYADSAARTSDRVLRSSDSNSGMLSSWLNNDRRNVHESNSAIRPEDDMVRSPSSGAFMGGMSDYERDIKSVLYEIRKDVKSTRSDIQETNRKFDRLEESVNDLRNSHEDLKQENNQLHRKLDNLTKKVDQMENQSRRENLIFHGMTETDEETWEQSETKVRHFISDDLSLDDSRISIERAHRLNTRKSPRPVIVKFSHYKDKEKVLRTYRENVKELKENQHVNEDAAAQGQPSEASDDRDPKSLFGGICVAEDFSARVRKARASLRPFLRDYLKNKQDAFIKFDKLVVDDVTYVYDEIEKKLVRE